MMEEERTDYGSKKEATEIGMFLRRIRVERNMTQKEMAEKLDISGSMLYAIETGARKVPAGFVDMVNAAFQLKEEARTRLYVANTRQQKRIEVPIGSDASDAKIEKIRDITSIVTDCSEKRVEIVKIFAEILNTCSEEKMKFLDDLVRNLDDCSENDVKRLSCFMEKNFVGAFKDLEPMWIDMAKASLNVCRPEQNTTEQNDLRA